MTKKDKSLNKISPQPHFIESHEDDIMQCWHQEIQENPQFANEDIRHNENLQSVSKGFLKQVLNTLHTDPIPSIPTKELQPLFTLWRDIIRNHEQQGFTTKDTAMLLYSLKTSMIRYIDEHKQSTTENQAEFAKFGQLLDFLGLLTLEVYTTEKERVIRRQSKQIEYLQAHQKSIEKFDKLVGQSPQMKRIFKAIGFVLENDITVLLEGESGTGKDVIASIIHQNSSRKQAPYIPINCGAIPKDLLESELFGYEKGAFTGADQRKVGKIELAHKGTLFLDEIGEMPIDMQVKLLRFLQNQEFERVGGTEKIAVDIRIIAATNQRLKELVDTKKFRLDLYYRLHVFPLEIPPLRDRKPDIMPLAAHFLQKYSDKFKVPPTYFSDDAEVFLLNHHFEGNVRELENLIQRAVIMANGHPITALTLQLKPGEADFDDPSPHQLPPARLTAPQTLADIEKQAILAALDATSGNIQRTAKQLGISRTTLYSKLSKYNISH